MFRDVSFRYDDGDWALRKLSFSLSRGEWLALMGAGGSGKSTVARLACRLLRPSSGVVEAGRVGYVAQDPQANIVGETVGEDVGFALREAGVSADEIEEVVASALGAVGMSEAIQRRMASLSGGELQRVAIAAALARGARFLVMDEPTSHLSTPAVRAFWDAIEPVLRRAGVAVLLITHRLQEAMRADSIAFLAKGQLAAHGPVAKLSRRPELLHLLGVAQDPIEAIAGWCERGGREIPWPTNEERLVGAVCSLLQASE